MSYLLFAGEDYYPEGGAWDLQGRFDTIDAAIAGHDARFDYNGGWANVLCLNSLKIVKVFGPDGEAWRDPEPEP
ncbi:MAG: hypothetical protein K2W80_11330 [Burkholderiales bacterium]|nr:hypothetical protein [Burkholderiales bacterium]